MTAIEAPMSLAGLCSRARPELAVAGGVPMGAAPAVTVADAVVSYEASALALMSKGPHLPDLDSPPGRRPRPDQPQDPTDGDLKDPIARHRRRFQRSDPAWAKPAARRAPSTAGRVGHPARWSSTRPHACISA